MLNQRLAPLQSQRQRLAPRFYQSVAMMSLPLPQLRKRVEEEIQRNPALEIETSSLLPEGASSPLYEGSSSGEGEAASDRKQRFLEGTPSRGETLADHLLVQLRIQPLTREEIRIGELLIGNLDENGFHLEDPSLLVEGNSSSQQIQKVIPMIQRFDPVGTCVQNSRESLLIQATVLADVAPAGTLVIISQHLTLLAQKKYRELSSITKLSLEDLTSIFTFIRSLEPCPGRRYARSETAYIVPDLIVSRVDDSLLLSLNEEDLPILRISSHFQNLQKSLPSAGETSVFVAKNLREAKNFIASMSRRHQTLSLVGGALLETQRAFFLKGPLALRPLGLKEIAEIVHVHDGTVSRIVSNKYMQTEWGIFPLKFLFSRAVPFRHPGGKVSTLAKEAIKEMIRDLIKKETTNLSDQKIAFWLKEQGIQVARRTVNKYRKELRINASRQRSLETYRRT